MCMCIDFCLPPPRLTDHPPPDRVRQSALRHVVNRFYDLAYAFFAYQVCKHSIRLALFVPQFSVEWVL